MRDFLIDFSSFQRFSIALMYNNNEMFVDLFLGNTNKINMDMEEMLIIGYSEVTNLPQLWSLECQYPTLSSNTTKATGFLFI